MIRIDGPKRRAYKVTLCLSPSKRTGYALSTSQRQNQNYPRSGIIFIHNVDVNVCLWCSQLTTEIINQKQLQCTWQIAALPSLRGTCFIYTSSLVACWLITSQVQYSKVGCWHRLHLGFPQGSHTLESEREISPPFWMTIHVSGWVPMPLPLAHF